MEVHRAYCKTDRTPFSKTQSQHNRASHTAIHRLAFIPERVQYPAALRRDSIAA